MKDQFIEGKVVQLSVSKGGVPKTAVPSARITENGVEGDRQANPEIHGGPDRAVCLFAMERILLGDAVALEVTRYTSPCVQIRAAFADGDFKRISQKRHAGWSRVYARVLVPGTVRAGDPVRVLPPGVGETK